MSPVYFLASSLLCFFHLPGLEADHVAGLARVVARVRGTQEGDHVDPLRARGPGAPAQNGHVPGSVLDGGAQVLEGERASAHDDDALAPELQVPQLVGVAVADVAPELVLVPVDDVAPLADAAVHGEHHELAPHPIHGNWLVAIGRSPLLRHGYDQNNIRHSALSKSLMIITIQK